MNRLLIILISALPLLSSCKEETIDIAFVKENLPEAINIEAIYKKNDRIYFAGGREQYGVCYAKEIQGHTYNTIHTCDKKINTIAIQNNKLVLLGNDMYTATYDAESGSVNTDISYQYLDPWPKTKTSFRKAISLGQLTVIVGGRDQKNGNIYSSVDFESDQIHVNYQENQGLYDVVAFHQDSIIACGYGTVIKQPTKSVYTTKDESVLLSITGEIFTGIDYLDDRLVLCSFGGSIYTSEDNGSTWQRKYQNKRSTSPVLLNDIAFISAEKLIAVGEKGVILFSSDSGESWDIVANSSSEKLICISKIENASSVIIGGAGGTILNFSF